MAEAGATAEFSCPRAAAGGTDGFVDGGTVLDTVAPCASELVVSVEVDNVALFVVDVDVVGTTTGGVRVG